MGNQVKISRWNRMDSLQKSCAATAGISFTLVMVLGAMRVESPLVTLLVLVFYASLIGLITSSIKRKRKTGSSVNYEGNSNQDSKSRDLL